MMLVDLLDKRALELENLESLRSRIYSLSIGSDVNKLNVALSNITNIANNIRNYDLLIYDLKSKLNVTIGEQDFDLNTLDFITASIETQIKAINIVINNASSSFNATDLINSRTSLQGELNSLNKASDKVMWEEELKNG